MNAATQNANIDDLLDGTLDDLADAPQFKPFPAGAHVVKLNWDVKNIGNSPAIEAKFTHQSTAELANPDDELPKPGDTCSTAFILKDKEGKKNELAEGQWKEILKNLKEGGVAGETNREIMDASNGMEVMLVSALRKDKNDPSKFYLVIKSVNVI
jgi:hypothetical protein